MLISGERCGCAVPPSTDAVVDDILSIREGRLFVEDVAADELARRFGTPIYVMSENGLRRRVRRYAQAFQERWPEGPVHILPSIKANYSLALRNLLTQEGVGCDTFGLSELYAALQCGVPPALISVNGSSKDRPLIERALRAGARITLDSPREMALVRAVARDLTLRARVRFRVRPAYADLSQPSDFHDEEVSIRDAAQAYKPGIPTEALLQLGPEALAAPELDVSGVMVHLGRHSTDLEVWRRMARDVGALVGQLHDSWAGWEPREIDLGGGFASPRDPTARATARGAQRPAGSLAPTVEDYAQALTEGLRGGLSEAKIPTKGKILEVEPGRGLYADAGIHLATVRNLKSQSDPVPRSWVETDTSEVFLLDTLIERNRWIPLVVENAAARATTTVDIVGISCGFDVIVPDAQLPPVREGDHIAFLDTGAYQDATAANFNAMPRPATVLVNGGEAEVIKRAETIEEVFRRDIVPDRLRASPSVR
jgi:diaminopimelate decarboxylase